MKTANKQPKVSVSIITYNHEDYLAECLESIVTQECDFSFEVVVGEDCSTDATRDVLKQYVHNYPKLIVPIYQKSNVGWQQNYIDVLKKCKGEYIAHIDGDDCALADKLQKQVDFLDKHQECSMVFHNAQIFGENIKKNAYNNPLQEESCIIDINKFVQIGVPHWNNSSKMFRKKSLKNFEFVKNLHCIGDQYLHLESAKEGKIAYIAEVLGKYRKHENGFSTRNKQKDRISCALRDILVVYNNAYRYGVKKDIVDKRLAFVYFDVACQYLVLKAYDEFRECMEKSYENKIFFNKNHKLCFYLKKFPHVLYTLKILNSLIYRLKGKQKI